MNLPDCIPRGRRNIKRRFGTSGVPICFSPNLRIGLIDAGPEFGELVPDCAQFRAGQSSFGNLIRTLGVHYFLICIGVSAPRAVSHRANDVRLGQLDTDPFGS